MKTDTLVSDIAKCLAVKETEAAARQALAAWLAHATNTAGLSLANCVNPSLLGDAQLTNAAKHRAAEAFARVPKSRRDMAESTIKIALEIGKDAARQGGSYSGDTTYRASFGDAPSAQTWTEAGDKYSGRCKYSKTDATHFVTMSPAGVICLVENEALREASKRDGLHLISLMPDNSAVWVKRSGKQIASESGWCLGNGSVCYHSTKSREDCEKGLAKKLAAAEKLAREERQAKKDARRHRLIAKLCGSVIATIDDARALGYCAPGIQAFQQRHGIGDTATLPQLMATKDASAVRLALSIARKVKHA